MRHWGNAVQILARLVVFAFGVGLLGLQVFYPVTPNYSILVIGSILVITSLCPKFQMPAAIRNLWPVKASKALNQADETIGPDQETIANTSHQPINNKNDDFLGYQGYAEILAACCADFSSEGSRVVSIESPWGNGKTSLKNLTCNKLRELDNKIKIIPFDIWFFSNESDLISLLIEELIKTLGGNEKEQFKKLLKLVRMANKINPEGYSQKIIDSVTDQFFSGETIYKQKDHITKELKKSNHKILVIIDDIDRLQPRQILDLFKMVKAVLDLPNVNFLLLYDKGSIENCLKKDIKDIGYYLGKIIQDPFPLLQNEKSLLMSLLSQELDEKIQKSINEKDFLKRRWGDVYWSLLNLIDTPRLAKKVAHVVNSSYERVEDEVNLVEYICIQAIGLKDGKLFRLIYRHKNDLTDEASSENITNLNRIISDPKREFNAESVALLRILFPRLNGGF